MPPHGTSQAQPLAHAKGCLAAFPVRILNNAFHQFLAIRQHLL